MNRAESNSLLSGELIRLGLPENLSRKISADLSGVLAESINQFEKGPDMVELMGAVTMFAIARRISAAYPRYSTTDQGIMSRAQTVITQHPEWTEDQVYAEVEKTVKPASQGGYLVVPQALKDQRNRIVMVAVGAMGAIVLLSFLSRKRQTID